MATLPSTFPAGDPAAPGSTILLIEDDDALGSGLAKLLHRHGYQVVRASNGKLALQLLQRHRVRLVVTDIYMDGMDGLETIIRLRRERCRLPVIAISGGSPLIRVNCLEMARLLGADLILDKPVRIDDLLRAITALGAAGQT